MWLLWKEQRSTLKHPLRYVHMCVCMVAVRYPLRYVHMYVCVHVVADGIPTEVRTYVCVYVVAVGYPLRYMCVCVCKGYCKHTWKRLGMRLVVCEASL